MVLHILVNNKDIKEFGLDALDGTLNALIKPSDYKPMVKNENAAMHGTDYVCNPNSRRKKETNISIPFLLRGGTIIDMQRRLKDIENFLCQGDGTGCNEFKVYELNTTYYFIYDSIATYSNFGLDGSALVTIKFIEPNPNNRKTI